jgi:polygalacturonase
MVVVKGKTGAAIQSAIDKAAKRRPGEARLVLVPAGVYSVEAKAIYLKKGVKLFCGRKEIKFN